MPHPILTALIFLAVAALATAGWLTKAEMETRDEHGDPIEQDEQP